MINKRKLKIKENKKKQRKEKRDGLNYNPKICCNTGKRSSIPCRIGN